MCPRPPTTPGLGYVKDWMMELECGGEKSNSLEYECITDEEGDDFKKVHDFRRMPRISKACRNDLKRLQEGPRRSKLVSAQKTRTGIVLGNLVERIAMTIPEIRVGDNCKKKPRKDAEDAAPVSVQHRQPCGAVGQPRQPGQDEEDAAPVSEQHMQTGGAVGQPRQDAEDAAPGQEDQCLAMLEKMNIQKVDKQRKEIVLEPLADTLKEMKIVGGEEDDRKSTRGIEDHWEEFSDSEEEREALKLIAEAEVELLKEYAGYKTPRKAATSMQTPSPPPSKKRRMPVKKTSAKKQSPSSKRCEQPRKTSRVLEDATQGSEQHRQTCRDIEDAAQEEKDQPIQTGQVIDGAVPESDQPRQARLEDAAPVSEQHRQTGGAVEQPRQAMLDKSPSHTTGLTTWQEDQ